MAHTEPDQGGNPGTPARILPDLPDQVLSVEAEIRRSWKIRGRSGNQPILEADAIADRLIVRMSPGGFSLTPEQADAVVLAVSLWKRTRP